MLVLGQVYGGALSLISTHPACKIISTNDKKALASIQYVSVVQMEEQKISNLPVVGSSPTGDAINQ